VETGQGSLQGVKKSHLWPSHISVVDPTEVLHSDNTKTGQASFKRQGTDEIGNCYLNWNPAPLPCTK